MTFYENVKIIFFYKTPRKHASKALKRYLTKHPLQKCRDLIFFSNYQNKKKTDTWLHYAVLKLSDISLTSS